MLTAVPSIQPTTM